MLYSSSKANVINAAENEVSLKVVKKVSYNQRTNELVPSYINCTYLV